MPTYEYECDKCKKVFEEYQSIIAAPLKTCRFEGCDGSVRRLLSSGAGFLLKGSGFYATDYRSDSYKQKAKTESGNSSTPGSASSSTSTSGSSTPASSSSGSSSGTDSSSKSS